MVLLKYKGLNFRGLPNNKYTLVILSPLGILWRPRTNLEIFFISDVKLGYFSFPESLVTKNGCGEK